MNLASGSADPHAPISNRRASKLPVRHILSPRGSALPADR